MTSTPATPSGGVATPNLGKRPVHVHASGVDAPQTIAAGVVARPAVRDQLARDARRAPPAPIIPRSTGCSGCTAPSVASTASPCAPRARGTPTRRRGASPECRPAPARPPPSSRRARPRTECPPCASASASSAPRPNTNGSPPFSRTTRLPCRAARIISAVDRLLRHAVAAARACRRRSTARCVSAAQRVGIDQRVVEHQVGFLRRAAARAASRARDRPGPAPTSDTLPDRQSPVFGLLVQPVQRLEQLRPPLLHRHAVALPRRAAPRPPRPSTRRGRTGSHASSASRSRPASAGARPSVEIATVTPSRRTTPPRYAVACAGSSTAFTKTRRALRGRAAPAD